MKTILTTCLLALSTVAMAAKPEVIPELRQWTDAAEGGQYTLAPSARVVVAQDADPALARYAKTFAEELALPLANEWQAGDIRLTVKPEENAKPEQYTIKASAQGIEIEAPTPLGAFWGTRSLLQVFAAQNKAFPCGVAVDWPAYPVRGFLFDCGRKPFTLTTLRQIIDLCAYYKLNDLQLHLSDNYIWLHNYPGVQTAEDVLKIEPSAGAFRLESNIKGLTSTDLAYTKAEYKALLEYANARGVTIIPEIDVPGHALAMVRVRPDLIYTGSVGKKHDCERAALLDLKNPETFPFIASIFDEYIDGGLCPAEVIHIGADEYYGDNESYRAFADTMLKHILAKGKTPRLWGSLSAKRGQTPVISKGVQMNIWSLGWQNPAEAAAAGYDLINILDVFTYVVPSGTNSVGAYGDDINTKYLYEVWSPAQFGSPSRGAASTPLPPDHPQLLGGAWALWNDNAFLTDPGLTGRDLLARIRRNCAIVAQKTWDSASPTRSYATFLCQLAANGSPVDVALPQWERTYKVIRTGDEPLKLAEGDETDLWAVSPVNGQVGFRREGAQYTFNYALPKDQEVALTFRATPQKVELWVDGVLVKGTPARQFYPESCKFFTLPEPERDLR